MSLRLKNLKLAPAALAAVGALVGMLAAQPARADYIFTLDYTNLSGVPAGPYIQVDVNQTSSTAATITFTSLTSGGDIFLMGDDGHGAAAVNVNGAFSVSNIAGATLSGFNSPILSQSSGRMDGFGNFNLAIDDFGGFGHSTNKISFDLTEGSGGPTWTTTTTGSTVLAANSGGEIAASHMFVTPNPPVFSNGALCTGFAGGTVAGASDGSTACNASTLPAPEPSSLASMGFGLAALGLFLGWRRRKI